MNGIQVLQGVPAFALYLLVAIVLLVVFVMLYVWSTPHREFALIAQNNTAAALAFGGALLGFCLPLHSAISHSVGLLDCAVWGLIALLVQIAAFHLVRRLVPQFSARIERGEVATAILAAAVFLGVGLLNAACMTY